MDTQACASRPSRTRFVPKGTGLSERRRTPKLTEITFSSSNRSRRTSELAEPHLLHRQSIEDMARLDGHEIDESASSRESRAMILRAMALRGLGTSAVIVAVLTGGATASNLRDVIPRFSLSAMAATADDDVALRVVQVPRLPRQEIRLFLVPAGVAAAVRSRFDPRLSFIGSVQASRRARLVFRVPPLEPGRYMLGYWCRDCVPRGKSIGFQASPKLRVLAPAGEGCPTTTPNGNVPIGAATSSGRRWHGNGGLWAYLRPDGLLVTNALGGYKMLWVAKEGVSGSLRVQYRALDPPSPLVTARAGMLTGYDRPNATMSQMSFSPGCWQITGRAQDVSLSFVVQVVLGDS